MPIKFTPPTKYTAADPSRIKPVNAIGKMHIDRAIDHQRHAIASDGHRFYLYQRKVTGRACSCFFVETSPSSMCPICWGRGVVGGYSKRGTVEETFDVTYPEVTSLNVAPVYETQSRPVAWGLYANALRGHVTFTWVVPGSWTIDAFTQLHHAPSKTHTVSYYIQGPLDDDFVELTTASLTARLIVGDTVLFRVNLQRRRRTRSPMFSHFSIRQRITDTPEIMGDVSRPATALTVGEYGVYTEFSGVSIVFDDTVRHMTTLDFVHDIETGQRLKFTNVTPFYAFGKLMFLEVETRLVQDFEIYLQVP